MLRRCEHDITRDLADRPGGGRHRNKGQRRCLNGAPFSHHLKKLKRLAAVGNDAGNRLSGVDRAVSAQRSRRELPRRAQKEAAKTVPQYRMRWKRFHRSVTLQYSEFHAAIRG